LGNSAKDAKQDCNVAPARSLDVKCPIEAWLAAKIAEPAFARPTVDKRRATRKGFRAGER